MAKKKIQHPGKLINAKDNQGQAILETINNILDRCDKGGVKIGIPGEGGERRFRGWLISDLLINLLGWPSSQVHLGERFDIIIENDLGFPFATIETKSPGHKTTDKEQADFETRLSNYGTLRAAFITNGKEWQRLDILSPQGNLEIQSRETIENIETVAPSSLDSFFSSISSKYTSNVRLSGKRRVSKDNAGALEAFAQHLNESVEHLANFLEKLFLGIREEHAGDHTLEITLNLFNRWCEESLIVPPERSIEILQKVFENEDATRKEIIKALMEMGFTENSVADAADAIGCLSKVTRSDKKTLYTALWPIYSEIVKKFCIQTAHVFLARALLYRIGEDQNVFDHILTNEPLWTSLAVKPSIIDGSPTPAIDLLARVRRYMENFSPAVYNLGEFDWWQILPESRSRLSSREKSWLKQIDRDLEHAARNLILILNGYYFGNVDVDVWRNIYQSYLPADERQRLGGFYTPDILVDLVLDLSEFLSESENLCTLSFIDPACGSGAFMTSAVARLLKHFDLDLPCHRHLHTRNNPEWKKAEAILNIISSNLHAVDLHPFAAFLTTINILFLLMPLYVKARSKNPDFLLDLKIFSSDSLEKHDEDLEMPDLFAKLNSRVQLAEDAYRRYQELLKIRFDRVFGNPPWGGVLKGHLAPVYDIAKKARFTKEYPSAANGKYDIYGLFMERALQILNENGRFALITQGTFIDKEWAAKLRVLLATKARLSAIVDLNPFGQLFFNAMNSPCITVADAVNNNGDNDECMVILSSPPDDFTGLSKDDKIKHVDSTVRKVMANLQVRNTKTVKFATGIKIPLPTLKSTADKGWNLSTRTIPGRAHKGWLAVTDILEISQGVTPGGEGCLDIFLIPKEKAQELNLEDAMLNPIIKGLELSKWRIPPIESTIIYPYKVVDDHTQTAFKIDLSQVENVNLKNRLRDLAITDALDFDQHIDRTEKDIALRDGVNRATVSKLLKHRIALGLVTYPKVANYFVDHYETLEGRVFEKKNIREYNKTWYEFHRPRNQKMMKNKWKIIAPRLFKKHELRFAFDTKGIIPQDSCICLYPSPKTSKGFNYLRGEMSNCLGDSATITHVIKYCLAFLNSQYAAKQLIAGQRPTPKGFYALTDKNLNKILIPPPPNKEVTIKIIDIVTDLIKEKNDDNISHLEGALEKLIYSIV